jgi:hypothetical protein
VSRWIRTPRAKPTRSNHESAASRTRRREAAIECIVYSERRSREQQPSHPISAVLLKALQEAGAAKATRAPPLTQAQVDRVVAILRLAGSRAQSWGASER